MARTRNQRYGGEQMAKLATQARRAGWTITRGRRSNHKRWTSPSGQTLITSSTPSDSRSTRNHAARVRRAGLRP